MSGDYDEQKALLELDKYLEPFEGSFGSDMLDRIKALLIKAQLDPDSLRGMKMEDVLNDLDWGSIKEITPAQRMEFAERHTQMNAAHAKGAAAVSDGPLVLSGHSLTYAEKGADQRRPLEVVKHLSGGKKSRKRTKRRHKTGGKKSRKQRKRVTIKGGKRKRRRTRRRR